MGSRGARAARSLAELAAGLLVAAPLVPEWTPGWPERSPITLLAAIPYALAGLWIAWRRGPSGLTPRVLLLCGAFPLFALYTGNRLLLTSGDNLATRLIPSRLLTAGSADLSGVPPFDRLPLHYAGVRVGGRILSAFPTGTAVMSVPHAALALAGSRGRVDEALVERWEKHAAACLTLIAVLLFYLAARRFGRPASLGATAVLALATPLPTSASQALWTFTGELPCVTLALYLLLGRSAPALAGIAMGIGFLCRPTALLIGAVLAAVLAVRERRAAFRYALAWGVSTALVAAAQLAVYGHPLGAYGRGNTSPGALGKSFAEGLLGVLLSPSRGLLVFFPYLLLLPLCLGALRRQRDPDLRAWWTAAITVVLIGVVVTASYVKWWGGHSLGPRLMTEAAPFLALATIPLWTAGAPIRAAVVTLVAFSGATQVLMAYDRNVSEWNDYVLEGEGPASLFELGDSQIVAAWTPGWTPPPIDEPVRPLSVLGAEAPELIGSIDGPGEGERVRGKLVVRGWAREPGRDLDVLFLIDGFAKRPRKLERHARPDVQAALPLMGDCSSAGYEATFDHPAKPGPHQIELVLRAKDGRLHHFARRGFVSR